MESFETLFQSFLIERNPKKYAEILIQEPTYLRDLGNIIKAAEAYPRAAYASWLFTHLCKIYPKQMESYYPILVDALFENKDDSTLRNCCAALLCLDLTAYREGEFIDVLFRFLSEKTHAVALHVNAIYLILNWCKKYPELKDELRGAVSLLLENATPAMRVAAKKVN